MNTYYIYRHIRLDSNTPFYVGKGKGKRAFNARWRNKYWKNIINKHGYEVEIIMDGLTEKEAFIKEVEFIKLYKSLGYCEANLTDGGEGCSGRSPWNKGKTGVITHSKETRKKLSDVGKGRTPWNKGGTHSEQTKQKLRNTLKQINHPVPSFLGMSHSVNIKLRISMSMGSAPFYVFKGDIVIGIWINIRECARDLQLKYPGINHTSISRCLRGLAKTHKSLTFKNLKS